MSPLRRLRAGLLTAPLLLLLAVPGLALGAEDFDPAEEFATDAYIPIELGPIDLSINKAVVYLLLSAAISCGVMLLVIRRGLRMKPGTSQTLVEMTYEFAEGQVARATLPPSVFQRWFPYVATLFIFIAVNNLISFIPLPFAPHTGTFGPIPELGLYAATANINVTLGLAICTFVCFIWQGISAHGPIGYLKSLTPPGVKGLMRGFIFVLELLALFIRLVSLSVRLFANLLAGHLLIIMAVGFSILVGSLVGVVAIPFALFFWIFEWVLVAGLQAFIFALLSGIYIGTAAESAH